MLGLVQGCRAVSTPRVSPSPCNKDDPTGDVRCVAVGYGTQPSRAVTGAIGSYVVDPKDRSGVSRIEQLLDGRIAGLSVERQANGDYQLRVRGHAGEPLIVVDGNAAPLGVSSRVVLEGVMASSVARIDVLKDGASTAVYGLRGANGVVLITTRRAQ